MATTSLNNDGVNYTTGKDGIVIVRNLDSIRGGRSLDVTGFTPEVIQAGHVVIQDNASPPNFKPMPVNSGATAYAALPASHSYAGIVIATVPTKKAMVGILTNGTVNPNATPYPMASILSAVQTALPQITFRAD